MLILDTRQVPELQDRDASWPRVNSALAEIYSTLTVEVYSKSRNLTSPAVTVIPITERHSRPIRALQRCSFYVGTLRTFYFINQNSHGLAGSIVCEEPWWPKPGNDGMQRQMHPMLLNTPSNL